jgi:hypothetical protein
VALASQPVFLGLNPNDRYFTCRISRTESVSPIARGDPERPLFHLPDQQGRHVPGVASSIVTPKKPGLLRQAYALPGLGRCLS